MRAAETTTILDVEGCLARFGGDKELFVEMTAMLLEDAPSLFLELKSAIDDADVPQIEGRAHALKGLLANCGGTRAAFIAQQLEDVGRSQDLTNTRQQLEQLDAELIALIAAIRDYHDHADK